MQKIQVFLCFTWGERTQAQPISLPVSHNHGPCRVIIVLLLVVRWTVTQGSEDTAVRLSIGLYNTKLRPKAIVSVFKPRKKDIASPRRRRRSRFHLCQLPSQFSRPNGHKGKLRAAVRAGTIFHLFFTSRAVDLAAVSHGQA